MRKNITKILLTLMYLLIDAEHIKTFIIRHDMYIYECVCVCVCTFKKKKKELAYE
jgi:hypothetical protein